MNVTGVTIQRVTTIRQGGLSDSQELIFVGTREDRDGVIVLRFEEVLAEGEPPVPTIMVLKDQVLKMHRETDLGGDMIFEAATSMELTYNTPAGVFTMQLNTDRLDVFLSADIVEIDLKYRLFSEGELLSDVDMMIRAGAITPAGSGTVSK